MKTKLFLVPALFAGLTLAALSSAPSHAASFAPLKRPSSPALRAVLKAAQELKSRWSTAGSYRVTDATPARGRSPEELRLATLKQAVHAYFGADFSDGLNLSLEPSSEKGVDDAIRTLNFDSNSDEASDSAKVAALETALRAAIRSSGIELYAGDGSGNNTMGELIGLYDVENDELLYFGFSNFGSDD